MSNQSIFERNVIDAFRAYDVSDDRMWEAEALFLKHGGDLGAEADALAFLSLHARTDRFIEMAASNWRKEPLYPPFTGQHEASLKAFMRDTAYRHTNGNRRATPWPHWSLA